MKNKPTHTAFVTWLLLALWNLAAGTNAHDHTLHKFLQSRRAVESEKPSTRISDSASGKQRETCQLTIHLVDSKSNQILPGLVRIRDVAQNSVVTLTDLIKREKDWYTMAPGATMTVPQAPLMIEAFHGLNTELRSRRIDLTGRKTANVRLLLNPFYDSAAKGWKSGNTHLHLRNLTHAEADRYLREVTKSDGLDLVFLSHLRRIPDERHYISNMIVENSLAGGDLQRLSQDVVRFSPGQEHRHNFGRHGEGYGHVMFLDIAKLIRPVSIGPGIMQEGTDGIALQRGIKQARDDGASVIWCHNSFGMEDLPNWMADLLDAQNIFDGGTHGSYQDTFYRYLNIGMKVPFSTGTDWFIYDFSRVYVPLEGRLTSQKWLAQLAGGRTYITNGPFLELQAGNAQIGDTIQLSQAGQIEVQGLGSGRVDFRRLELIYNGEVIHSTSSNDNDGHFVAHMIESFLIDQPGWLALRIPLDAGSSELGKSLFAHTSPIYVELAGRRIFQHAVAQQLLAEMEQNVSVIRDRGTFADANERQEVLNVHQEGIAILRQRIEEHH